MIYKTKSINQLTAQSLLSLKCRNFPFEFSNTGRSFDSISVNLNSPKLFPRIALTGSEADIDKPLQHVASIKNQNITNISILQMDFYSK